MDGPNEGILCVKGKFGYKFLNNPDRLKTPLIKKNGEFVEATWEEAYDLIEKKARKVMESDGPDAFAGLSSARCTNEDNYAFQKLFRTVFRTNNVDHCARLWHSSTVAGLAATLGSGTMTNSIKEVFSANVIFVIGSNTTENHPVIGSKIKQAVKKGAKLIVADAREIELASKADIYLKLKPGTNIALLNGMMNVIISENLCDLEYIEKHTEGFETLKENILKFTPEMALKFVE